MQQAWDKNGKIYYIDDNGNRIQPQLTFSPFERIGRKIQSGLSNLEDFINENNPESRMYKDKVNLTLGALTAPIGGSSTLAKMGANALKPLVGKKIAQTISTGAVGGGTSGLVEGFGRGIVEGENPLKTAMNDALYGTLFGGGIGLGLGNIGKNLAKRKLYGDKVAQENYFNDYIADLSNKTKPMAEFRGLKEGVKGGGTGTQYLFAGESGFDTPKGKLMEAKQMSMYGDSVGDIYDKTGWFKGVDGKWRYEIPDGDIVQHPNMTKEFDNVIGTYYTTTIGDIYNSPELYRNYPQLKERSVIVQSMQDGVKGSSWGDSVSLNKDLYSMIDPEYTKKVTALENTPDYVNFKKYENDIFDELDSLKLPEELEKHERLMKELDDKTTEFYYNTPVGTEYKKLVWDTPKAQKTIPGFGEKAKKTLIHELQHQIQAIEGFARGGNAYNSNYQNLAGEVEARLASQRMNLTPEQRKIYNPAKDVSWLTNYGYDVIPEKQIVEFYDTRQSNLYKKLTDDNLKYRNEWVKIDGKDYRVLNLPKKDYGKILHILDTDLSKDIPIGDVLEKSDANYLYKFQKTSPTDYKFIGRKKLK